MRPARVRRQRWLRQNAKRAEAQKLALEAVNTFTYDISNKLLLIPATRPIICDAYAKNVNILEGILSWNRIRRKHNMRAVSITLPSVTNG